MNQRPLPSMGPPSFPPPPSSYPGNNNGSQAINPQQYTTPQSNQYAAPQYAPPPQQPSQPVQYAPPQYASPAKQHAPPPQQQYAPPQQQYAPQQQQYAPHPTPPQPQQYAPNNFPPPPPNPQYASPQKQSYTPQQAYPPSTLPSTLSLAHPQTPGAGERMHEMGPPSGNPPRWSPGNKMQQNPNLYPTSHQQPSPTKYNARTPVSAQSTPGGYKASTPTTGTPRSSSVRIDPKQMPRPSSGTADILYHTRSGGSGRRNPPASNCIYTAVDTGNCTPRHIRPTFAAPPTSKEVMDQTGVPFALTVCPFARPENEEEEVTPVVYEGQEHDTDHHDDRPSPTGTSVGSFFDFDLLGTKKTQTAKRLSSPNAHAKGVLKRRPVRKVHNPPRCTRCGGYINPSVTWTQEGHKWTCNLCSMTNATPLWYYCPLDGKDLRQDRLSRPELQLGSVDFVVNEDDYCETPMHDPVFTFAVDISGKALANGTTLAALHAIRSAVGESPL